MMRVASCLSALPLALALAGCGSSPPTRILTLDAVAPPAAAIRADYRGPPVAIPAVHVPAALDRAEYVSRITAGEAGIDDFARWAAPLGLLARDALVRDLTARLPAGAVLPPGGTEGAGAVLTFDVTILSLDAGPGGATLQAAYRIVPGGVVRQVSLQAPTSGIGPVPGAQAFGVLIGELADRIVADLPRARSPAPLP